MATTYRADIDGLRALAVLPVVLFHAGVPGFSGGYVGVDVFFVISGYLITGILAAETSAGRLSILGFYERRVRRILPALIAVCAVTAAAALAVMMPQDLREFGRSLAGAMLFFSNFVFAAGAGYFDAPAETKPLLHTWSLSIEEQFYLIFPWVMLWLRGRWRRPVLLALLGTSLAASIAGVRFDPENAFFMPHLRAWELLLGGLIALGWPPAAPRLAPALGLAGLALVLGPVFLYDRATPFPGLAALAPCIGAGLVILAGGAGPAGRLLSLRPVAFVGLVSYSLYLWHWPAIVFARMLAPRPPDGIETAALLIAVFALAVLSWRHVEQPFRRGWPGRRALFAAAGAGMAALVALAAVIEAGNGLPGRFPPAIAGIVAARQEFRAATDACRRAAIAVGRLADGAGAGEIACRIGDPARPPSVLLWGDSHALSLVPALDRAARDAGVAAWAIAGGGCPPLPGIADPARRAGECRALNDRVVEFIAAARPALVIIAARWALAATGRPMPGEDTPPMKLSPDWPEGNAAALEAGLTRAVAAARRAGARVVLVAGIPEPGFDVPNALARSLAFGRPPPQGPDAAAHAARQQAARAVLERLARMPGVSLLDPAAILCRPDCAVAREGRPLYFDDDHLSLEGAALMAPLLAPLLR